MHPGTRHVVWNGEENGFDLADLAILHFEKLKEAEGIGTIERRPDGAHGAVHQRILAQRAVVIEKGCRENHLPFFVYDEAAITGARDELEHPGFKLSLASHSLYRSCFWIGIIRGDCSVLHALAVGIERRVDLARVQLNGVEVAVGQLYQFLSGDALIDRLDLRKKWLILEVFRTS